MRKWTCALLLLISVPGPGRSTPAETAWPTWGQNARHTFNSPYPVHDQLDRERWRHTLLGGAYRGSCVIGNLGQVVFASIDGVIQGLRFDGRYLWSYAASNSIVTTPTITSDGLVIVTGTDGCIHAVDERDGQVAWVHCTSGSGIVTDPVLTPTGQIITMDEVGVVRSTSSVGGSLWDADLETAVGTCTPTVHPDGSIWVGTLDPAKGLVRISAAGVITDEFILPSDETVSASPAILQNGTVIIGTRQGTVYAMDEFGDILWAATLGGEILRGLSVGHGLVAVGSTDFNLYALDVYTGTVLWSRDVAGPIEAPPTMDGDGIIFVGPISGEIRSYYPDGTLKDQVAQGVFHGPLTVGGDGSLYGTIDWSVWGRDRGGPSVVLRPDFEVFGRGDLLEVSARITNPAPTRAIVDAKAWLEAPDRTVVKAFTIHGINIPAGTDAWVPVFSHQFSDDDPYGTYPLRGIILDPATGASIAQKAATVHLRDP